MFTGDAERVVRATTHELIGVVPQACGSALLVALHADHPEAPTLASHCVEVLRDRGDEGDEELAVELEAALGTGPTPMLRPLPIDLEQLADAHESNPTYGNAWIDLAAGQIWPPRSEYGDDGLYPKDPDENYDLIVIEAIGSRASYADMVDFADTLDDPVVANLLAAALSGRGAFRRFKDVLADEAPEELERYHAFSSERQVGRARKWLAREGYRAAAPGAQAAASGS